MERGGVIGKRVTPRIQHAGKLTAPDAFCIHLDAVELKAKRNHACRLAALVLQTVTHHKRRHDELQRFMLTTDSVTVAVEIPIFLFPRDLAHLKEAPGFQVPIETDVTLTGHIDLLQIRHGAIHILDYKPGANHKRPITQLMVYALSLSRRTGLRLYDFVCAWFDEHHYFESIRSTWCTSASDIEVGSRALAEFRREGD